MNEESVQPLIIGSLRFADDRVEELQDRRPIACVMRADVESVELRYGFLAQHPIVQLVFGLLLTGASGLITLAALLGYTFGKGVLAGAFVFLGLWVIQDGAQRGHYLVFSTTRGRRKIVVGRNLTAAQLTALKVLLDTFTR